MLILTKILHPTFHVSVHSMLPNDMYSLLLSLVSQELCILKWWTVVLVQLDSLKVFLTGLVTNVQCN